MKPRQIVRAGMAGVAVLVALTGAALLVHGARSGLTRRKLASARDSPARTLAITCRAPALGGQLPALVYLPPGYMSHGRRYPVVYFLHGLPAGPLSYTQNAFVAGSLVSAHEQAIVVAPQGARDENDDREYLEWSSTEDWPRAISHDLTACIDDRFHTIPSRAGRALIGLSAGGYGAFNIGLRNLQTFAAVESWSGYFVATDPSGYHALRLRSPAAKQAAIVPFGGRLAGRLARWPALIAFYVGGADQRFLAMNEAFDAALRNHRIAHVFRIYAGGHSAGLWETQAPAWLSLALRYLATRHSALQNGSVR
jgi:enterochelin esterase-like enzyme